MIAAAVGMTVLSAAGWSSLDVARKILVRRIEPVALLVFLCLGQVPGFAWWAHLQGRWIDDGWVYAPWGTMAVLLNVVANVCYLLAVRSSPLSVVIPLLSFVPVFTVAIANPLLRELPSNLQLVGITAVVGGALVLNGNPGERWSVRGWVKALVSERGALYMLVTALCWAASIVVDKRAFETASPGAHAMVMNAGVGVVMVVWLTGRRELGQLGAVRRGAGWMVIAVAAAGLGLGAQMVAVAQLMAGVVESIKRAIGMIVAVIVGNVGFDEPLTAHKLMAITLMIVGTATILVGG